MNKTKVTRPAPAKRTVKKAAVSPELIRSLVKKDLESLASGGSAVTCGGCRVWIKAS